MKFPIFSIEFDNFLRTPPEGEDTIFGRNWIFSDDKKEVNILREQNSTGYSILVVFDDERDNSYSVEDDSEVLEILSDYFGYSKEKTFQELLPNLKVKYDGKDWIIDVNDKLSFMIREIGALYTVIVILNDDSKLLGRFSSVYEVKDEINSFLNEKDDDKDDENIEILNEYCEQLSKICTGLDKLGYMEISDDILKITKKIVEIINKG
jgi:hypothetical protein